MIDLSQIFQVVLHPPLFVTIALLAVAAYLVLSRSLRQIRRLSMNYCIRGLSADQRQALITGGLPLAANAVNHEDDRLTRKQLKLALKLLHAKVVSARVLKPNQLEELILRFPAAKGSPLEEFSVVLQGRTGVRAKRVEQVVRDVLLPTVRKDIVVHSCWSRAVPIDDDAFHLFLHSTAHNGGRNQRDWANQPEQVWGLPVVSGAAFHTSGKMPFIDDESNFVVAELVDDNNLYVHFDAFDKANNGERGIFRRLGKKLKYWGHDEHLGVLTYVLSQIEKDLVAERYIAEVIAELKTAGKLPADSETAAPEAASSPTATVSVEGFSSNRRAEVMAAMAQQILLPVMGKDIELIERNGAVTAPRQRGKRRILVNSSPQGHQWVPLPESSFGYRLQGLAEKPNAFPPSPLGLPIADDSGHTVAELVGNRDLYLTSELVKHGSRSEAKLFAEVLLQVRRAIEQNLSSAEITAALFAKQLLAPASNVTAQKAAKKGEGGAKALRQARQELVTALNGAMAQQNEMLRIEATPTELLGREFDALLAIEKVLDVAITEQDLVVHTDTLYCTDPRSKLVHDIGQFKIYVPLNGKGNVRWSNQTRRMGQHHAPHVGENGLGCLGNTTSIFPALIAKREFAGAIEVAIAFVESVNVDDSWGKQINKWPVAGTRAAKAKSGSPDEAEIADGHYDEDGDDYYD